MNIKLSLKIRYLSIFALIPLVLLAASPSMSFAIDEQENETQCRAEQILVHRIANNDFICTDKETAYRWVELGIAEIITVEDESEDIPVVEESKEKTVKLHETVSAGESFPDSEEKSSTIPIGARGPFIDPEIGYLVWEIKDGIYWITDGMYNSMFLTTGEGVIAIDAPPTIGENYLKAISDVTDEPITHVIYSHTHIDHIGAASMYPDDAIIISHAETAAQLIQRQDPNRPVPEIIFDESYTLEVGNKRLELNYHGPIHESGNIFIYSPEEKVLMVVDVVFPGWVPFKNLAMAQDVPAYLAAHDKILEYDFDIFVGGHLTRLGTYLDVQIQKQYFDDIAANGAIAHGTVNFYEIAQQTGWENPWTLIDAYMDAVTQVCTDLTIPDWKDRLGGAESFTDDHCFIVTESQRID